MRSIPLYDSVPASPVGSGAELALNQGCRRCSLSSTARSKSVCLPADGEPGGLYFVGKHPGQREDASARVHVGESGDFLRSEVRRLWDGPVVFDNAARCFPGKQHLTDAKIDACRPYLRRALRQAKPEKIIALGSDAAFSLLGRHVPIMSVRRGYGWVEIDGRAIPVFLSIHPAAATRNYLIADLFRQDLAWIIAFDRPSEVPVGAKYHVVETLEDSKYAAAELEAEAPWFAYDLEWAGYAYGDYFEILTASACSSGVDESFVWPRAITQDKAIMAPLLRVLSDPNIGKVGHNLKGDNNAIAAAYGVIPRGSHYCTRLLRRILEVGADGHLSVCAELVGLGGHKEEFEKALELAVEEVKRGRRSGQRSLFGGDDPALLAAIADREASPKRYAYALVSDELRNRYCARDSVATSRLGDLLEGHLEDDPPSKRVWDRIVSRATDAIGRMERWGIAADAEAIRRLDGFISMELGEVQGRLRQYGDFDLSSPSQVGNLLYNHLGLKTDAKTDKGKPSTDKATLEGLLGKHPIISDLLEFRRLNKLRSSYTKPMAAHVRRDGRIHPEIKIDGARTGRLSIVDPPLHTLPKSYSVEGRMIKSCFVSAPDTILASLDYSQIELRVAAMLSGDEVMAGLFKSGEDFHLGTAKLVSKIYWGIEPEEVQDKHRSAAKVLNFGLLFGMSDAGLARRIGCSVGEAKRLREAIFGQWYALAKWIREVKAYARKHGFCWTWWDGERARRRPLLNLGSSDSKARLRAENGSLNTPVQGTASDFMEASICEIVEWIERDSVPAKLVLTVHDSVVLEIVEQHLDSVVRGVLAIMLGHNSKDMPIKVDVEVGKSLGDMKPYVIQRDPLGDSEKK